jgi:hypothetical protein
LPSLTVNSHPDAQILLIDGDLKLVHKGLATLTVDVPAGYYKVKAERGGGTVEQLVDLTQDQSLPLYVDKFPAIAPLQPLLAGNAWKVEGIGKAAMGTPGAVPGLLLLAHAARQGGNEPDPFAGLKVVPWSGGPGGELAVQPLHKVVLPEEVWRATWLPLPPGCHLLEITDAGETVHQAVTIVPGWQTRLFLRRSEWHSRTTQPDDVRRREWIDVSIQMATQSAAVVYSDHLETVEVARNALELNRPIIVSNYLIASLLQGKFENPIAGMTGLHLFLEALERSRPDKRDDRRSEDGARELQIDSSSLANADNIVRQGIDNLERLLCGDGPQRGPQPSDLMALKARAGLLPSTAKTIVVEPPMLWVSWDQLRRRCGPDQPVEVSPGLWKRIAWATAWGPYLAWPAREATVEDYVADHLSAPLERVRRSSSKLQLLEGDELSRALNIPLSLVRKE